MTSMSTQEQKAVFTFPVVVMFTAYLSSVVGCPAPRADELPLIFAIGVAQTLIPAIAFLFVARKLTEVK